MVSERTQGPPRHRPPRLWPVLVLVPLALVLVAAGAFVGYRALADGSSGEKDDGFKARSGALRTPLLLQPVTDAHAAPCAAEELQDPATGECLRTAPGMTVTRVARIEVTAANAGVPGHSLAIRLEPKDATAFGDLTRNAAQQAPGTPRNRIAVVAEGRLLMAPSVSAAILGGDVQISSSAFTRASLEALAARLTG